jgi:hypothetical protein
VYQEWTNKISVLNWCDDDDEDESKHCTEEGTEEW